MAACKKDFGENLLRQEVKKAEDAKEAFSFPGTLLSAGSHL